MKDRLVDLLVRSYLTLGAFEEARRAARLTADVVAESLTTDEEEKSRFARWLNDQFQTLIAEYEKSAHAYAQRARKMTGSQYGVARKPTTQKRRAQVVQIGEAKPQPIGA